MAVLGITIQVGFDNKGLKKANKEIGKFLKTGLKAGGAAAGVALGAVGTVAAVAASEAINFAEESNAAMEQFRRETGLAKESVEAFGGSAKNLFALGVGEDIDDIADAMATVNNTMQTGAKETENLTKRALTMRDVFDKDVDKSIDGVKVLMDEFGLSSNQAFDFMTEGIQKGLDRNGDFLESISEYGNLFSDAGFSADEFFSIMETGAAGGVLGTDKIADSVKEFGVIASEASDDTIAAFETIGLDFTQISEDVAAGNTTWADSFEDVIKGINSIENPIEKARIQTQLFGTMAEDLGVGFTEGLSTASTSLQDMSGAMDEIIAKNMTIGESMDTLNRQMTVALEPAAQELMPLLADGVAKISEFLTRAQPIFTDFAGELSGSLGPAIEIIGDSLSRIAAVFGVVDENASGMDAALAILKGTLDLVVTGIQAVAVATKLLADAFEIAKGLIGQVGTILGAAGEGLDILTENPVSAIGNVLGFQGSGVVPGSPSQAVPIIAHGGEEIANPNIGQSITINGETFAVRAASQMAAAINAVMQQNAQMIVDTVAANL
jgi:phage-related minor tail protein